ncbi:ATP-dependent DNA helicase [Sinimarinibacterium sp. NLF-5-8]|uniref:ATP-dependent DNA helicase n=1 Tax=Sinimarinibacterium sp. NLF-5-8 TaxID=2698684 RepID=UPI00137B9DA3|nr:ATP-dependent DNA helicase [Sinimarinibacterium sp. NLF-5-8]QHS09637.1 ATP-dependent DNA helicase [Sinimarinibacterium sp. NLF-5-8]
MKLDPATLASLLGSDGVLAQAVEGFAPRAAQQQMAAEVARAIVDETALVIEAGTGTGKTFAYLLPALLSGQRTIVSTGTRTLQDQLFNRDLPRLLRAIGSEARVALLKGRANYLCLYRMKRASKVPAVQHHYFEQWLGVQDWARRTATGELSELGEFADDAPLTRQITSTADNCLGSRCEDFENCFVARARRNAQAADLVVINHHLLLADFTLKDRGFGQILAGSDAIIMDEAHQLPELAAQFFGCRISTRQLQDLAKDVQIEAQNCGDLPHVQESAQLLSADVSVLAPFLARLSNRLLLARFCHTPGVAPVLDRIEHSIEALYQALKPLEERSAEFSGLLERTFVLRSHWLQVLDRAPADADAEASPEGASPDSAPPRVREVRWVEAVGQGGSLNLTPIDLSDSFARMRSTYPGAWILTSATLAAGHDFKHFVDQLGLPAETPTTQLQSPFDFATQARLYLPPGLPDPNDPTYPQAIAEAALPVIQAAGGGAFVLCTSYRALRVIAQFLREQLSLNVLVQGEDARSALLDRFVADGNAVLVGTSSFWEGVDVRGQALRVVIIDRLPFAAPGDPVLDAKIEAIKSRGGSAFFELQLPEAIIMLRQGAGRLIRDPQDRGLLMLCDPRLTQKSYGRKVLAALPPMPRVRDAVAVTDWLDQIGEACA